MDWLKTNVIVILMAVQIIIGGAFWASSLSNTASTSAAEVVSLNSRMDAIYSAINDIRSKLPVMVEQIAEANSQIAGAKGDYANLDVRLRAIESNIAAVHQEATHPEGRR